MHAEDQVSPQAVAAELDRVCASSAFRHSHRHQQFLRYLVACKLDGRFGALREIALGIDFFHRSASTYDPKVDAVVRVEAARLRQRLDRYYHGEGSTAPFEILLDKGSYRPVFRLRAAAAVASAPLLSIAVLPIAPVTAADAERAAALTDEIVQTLARVPHVRVFGPASADAAGVATDPRNALQRLNIAWIVRGRWCDEEAKALLLEVVSTASGTVCMSKRVDADRDSALAMHQRVRTELLHACAALLPAGADAARPSELPPTVATQDLAAFDLYQRARYLLKQRSRRQLETAILHLEAAVTADPGFAAAWTELAGAYVRRRQVLVDAAQRDAEPAQRAAQRAIDLDPANGSAYAILAGLAYVAEFDWPKADRLFARALAATPRDLGVRQALATFLMFSARFDEALREYDVIQALDPLDPATRCGKGALYFYWRRYERAATLLEQAIEMAPQDVYAWLLLADTCAQSGQVDAGLQASRHLVEMAPDYANAHVYLARALIVAGNAADAAETIARARARFGSSISEYEEAMLHVARGDGGAALACLERHALRKANGAHCMVVDPTFAPLHRAPGWRSMLQRAGLPDFSQRLQLQPS